MATLNNRKRQSTKRVLVYGPPKVGKSQLVGTLAKEHKLLWFDLENGHDVLYKLPEEAQANIELIVIPDSRSNPAAIDTMAKLLKGVKGDVCHEHGKINCAVCKRVEGSGFDHVDMAAQRASNHYIVVIDSLTQLNLSARSHISKGRGDNPKFDYDDWAMLNALIDMILSEVQAASYDIVVISHEDEVEQTDGTKRIVPISATRNFSKTTSKYFSDVIYCEVRNKQHIAGSSTGYKPNIQTGSRSDIVLEKDGGNATLLPFFTHRK